MRRHARTVRVFSVTVLVAGVAASCGSRTGLEGGTIGADASPDSTLPDAAPDVGPDAPLFEGGPLDAPADCGTPAYCDPSDPGFIYQCGVRVFQCSSLEQCGNPCVKGSKGACCLNPCVDTLGQDTSNGCEFYAAEMDLTQEAVGVCYAVFIVNQWKTGEPARIQVDLGGSVLPVSTFTRIPSGTGTNIVYAPFDAAKGLAKDEIAVLFLSRDPAAKSDPTTTDPRYLADCPPGVVPAVVGDAAVHGTGSGTAFHIKTNVPVVAYQMLPYGGGSARITGATLLLPTNVWGTNYLAANAYRTPTSIMEPRSGPTMVVLGETDGTHVTIKPVTPITAGGGLAGGPAGVATTYTVNKGRYLQFTQPSELTGSIIQSDAPVAVIGGSTLMDVPTTSVRADSGEQMLPPIQALGNEYAGVRYRNRRNRGEESVPWRIVGAVNGTTLTFDPPQMGAPPGIDAGRVVEFQSTGPFVVTSQDAAHPFYFAQYMTGGQIVKDAADLTNGEGDPEFVNVIPPSEYLSRYTFFTDPTYPETNLVVVRARDATTQAFPDAVLDCAGTLAGWQPIGASGKYEFVRVDLSTGNFEGQGGCNNGVHTMSAVFSGSPMGVTGQIGVTIWGWGNNITLFPDQEDNPLFTRWVSYGYPAGANVKKLNDVVVPAK